MKTDISNLSEEEQVLREVFSKTKMRFLNEHFLEFNFGDKFLLEYDDLNNNVSFDIEMIYEEFKSSKIETKLNETEISVIIKKLMKEVFNIDGLNNVQAGF
jgi:hypothetical protein